jgi:hypothetical protein
MRIIAGSSLAAAWLRRLTLSLLVRLSRKSRFIELVDTDSTTPLDDNRASTAVRSDEVRERYRVA